LTNRLIGEIGSIRAALRTIDPYRHPAVYRLDVEGKPRSALTLNFNFHA
jgi:hypothetical protein